MPPFSDVFLVSSPLQAIVVDSLLAGEQAPDVGSALVVVEDARLADLFDYTSCFAIRDTRLDGRINISANVNAILSCIERPVALWVSDILWPMNNAIYTSIRKKRLLRIINFFDEGIVLYWQDRLSFSNFIRETAKFQALKWRLGVPFSTPARAPFYDNHSNGTVYALHPELLSRTDRVKQVDLDLDRVERIFRRFAGGGSGTSALTSLDDGSALFLSQPYYRISGEAKYQAVIRGLVSHLRASGHSHFYVKLHPSEGVEVYNRYYRDLDFKIAFPDMKAPIEAALRSVPSSCTLVSFNSSALLNARKFGFAGRSVAYGLDWVAALYPLHRGMSGRVASVFKRADVVTVPHETV